MSEQVIRYRAKRIDMDREVCGHHFTTPLTDENSGAPPEAGWTFLAGETRHCIVQDGVAFVVDMTTLEPVAEDVLAVLQQDDALLAEVLGAVLPSERDLAGAILVAIDEAQPGDDGNTALVAARAARKAMGVTQ